jgi:leucyl-tRNA synthetase
MIVAAGAKMSKSKGNAVEPEEYLRTVGADVFRAYLMFLGPWEQGGDWNDDGITGPVRFARRVWTLADESGVRLDGPIGSFDRAPAAHALRQLTHRTLQGVADDLARFRFNTMVAKLMTFAGALADQPSAVRGTAAWHEAIRTLLLMLAPSMPHLAEELWARLGGSYSIHQQGWPAHDPALTVAEMVEVAVQVDGKVRDRLTVGVDADEASVVALARASERIERHLEGRAVAKVIYVPGRLLSLVTRPG